MGERWRLLQHCTSDRALPQWSYPAAGLDRHHSLWLPHRQRWPPPLRDSWRGQERHAGHAGQWQKVSALGTMSVVWVLTVSRSVLTWNSSCGLSLTASIFFLTFFFFYYFLSVLLHPTKTHCQKRLCLIVPCVSSYRRVHFSGAGLHWTWSQPLLSPLVCLFVHVAR